MTVCGDSNNGRAGLGPRRTKPRYLSAESQWLAAATNWKASATVLRLPLEPNEPFSIREIDIASAGIPANAEKGDQYYQDPVEKQDVRCSR